MFQRGGLDLADSLPRHAELPAQIRQRMVVARANAVANAKHVGPARVELRKRVLYPSASS